MPTLINPLLEEEKPFDTEWFDQQATNAKAPFPEKIANKVAAMGAIMDEGDVAAQYYAIRQSLTLTGKSEDIERLKGIAQMDMEDDDVQSAEIILRDPSLSKEDKLAGLYQIQDRINQRKGVKIEDAFVADQLLKAPTKDATEERTHQNFFRNEAGIQQSNSEIQRILEKKIAKGDVRLGSALIDFSASAVLPGFAIKLKQVIDEALPGEGSVFENLAVGERVEFFHKMMRDQLEPEERVEVAKKLVEAVDDTFTSSFHDNHFEKYDLLTTLLGELNPSDAEIESERWLNNFFGVLDLVPLAGTAAAKLIRVTKRVAKSSALNHMASSAPRKAEEYAHAALADDEVATALGASKEEILSEGVMPKDPTESIDVFPDLTQRLSDLGFDLRHLDDHSINYTPAEREAAQASTLAERDRLAEKEGVMLLSKSDIEEIPGGYQTDFTLGHSNAYGFPTLQEAKDAVEGYLEVQQGAKVTYLKRDFRTGEFRPIDEVDETLKETGEFLAKVRVRHVYNPGDALGEPLEDAVQGVAGGLAKYVDKASVFARWIDRAGNVAADKAEFIKKELNRNIKPLLDLNATAQGKVFEVLDEGNSARKWFNAAELHEKFNGSQTLIDAYNGARRHQEAIYELQNERLRRKLLQSGYRQISNEDGTFTNVAKPLRQRDVPDGITKVYDPELKALVEVRQEDISALYERGGKLARMPSGEKYGNEWYDIVRLEPGSKTKMTELPPYVLRKIEGYISGIYDANYVVKALRKGVRKNGKLIDPEPIVFNGRRLEKGDQLVAVRMASNKGSAERYSRQLAADGEEGVEYGVVEAREIQDLNYAYQHDYQSYYDRGQMYFSKRGEEVLSVTGERTLAAVGDAMERAREAVSRHMGMDDYIDSMTTRWEKKFGDRFGMGPQRKMPMSESIPRPADPSAESLRDWREAIALRDHIRIVAGADEPWTRQAWNRLAINIADKLAGAGRVDSRMGRVRSRASEYVLSKRTKDPISTLKQIAFLRFISLNPIRQIVLQSQQTSIYLGVDHGFRYFASGRGVLDMAGLTLGMMTKNKPKLWRTFAPDMAKSMGMSTAEYKQLVDAFNQSGLFAAVDSHPFANAIALGRQGTFSESKFTQSWKAGKELARTIARHSRMVGFDAGEYSNIAAAWLATRNKWIKNNPGKNWAAPETLAEIGGEARSITLNMNRAGSLAFQKGTMGLLTQFMSHATKSVQILIPQKFLGKTIGKLSHKAFSGKERARIAMLQLALYGTGGYGLHSAWEKLRDEVGIDGSVEVPGTGLPLNTIIREGINGSLLNAALRAADPEGEESEVQFSPNFGPLSGTPSQNPVAGLVKGIIEGQVISPLNLDTWRQMGAGLSLAPEIRDLWNLSHSLMYVDDADVSTPEKALVVVREMGKFLPAYSNFVRGLGAQRSGQMTSRFGNPTVTVTTGEIMTKMLFGLRSQKEVEVSDMLRQMYGYTQSVGQDGLNKELEEAANVLYKNTLRLAEQLAGGRIDAHIMEKISRGERLALREALGDVHFAKMMEYFQNRVFNDLNENQEARLVRVLMSAYSGKVTPPKDDLTNKVRNMVDFKGKEELLKWIDYML